MFTSEQKIKARRSKWDLRFLDLMRHVAQWSKDPSTKCGAVVVGVDPRKISLGYNGFPPGIADDHRLEDRATKYLLVNHAEENAIANATFDCAGGTIYCTHPCVRCARAIVTKRIARVVCPPLPKIEAGRWTEELPLAQSILEEAGVRVDVVGD